MISLHRRLRMASLLTSLVAGVSLAACDGTKRPPGEMRLVTDDFIIRVSVESLPVRAMETIRYRVVVADKETGKPIEGGQGRVFATNADRKTTYNGLEPSGEIGTYKTTLYLVTSGLWAVAIQFRRDSTQPLQKTEQWTQDVLTGDPIGTIETPKSNRLDPDSVRRADSTARADSIKKADSAKTAPPAK
jgi:HAMP domain-containing protein